MVRIRIRIPSSSLSPERLVARLLWARSGTETRVTWEDYKKARGGPETLDLDQESFLELLRTTRPDPGFLWRDHPFRPGFRDADGREYEILSSSPRRIDLVREDGVTGYSSPEEFGDFFQPIIQKE